MNISSLEVGFTKGLYPGRFAYKLTLSDIGIPRSVQEMCASAMHFPRMEIDGDKPFLQREDIAKLIKKLKTCSPLMAFDIYCTGTIKPVRLGNVDNINYIIFVTPELLGEKADVQTLNWFITMGAKFLFIIDKEDEADRVVFMLQDYNISKANTFLCSNDVHMLEKCAKIVGCNYLKYTGGELK